MGGEWLEKTLGDVVELKRGYDLPKKQRQPGDVPIISSAGISDTHVVAKVKGPGVVTGRYGTIGEVYYSEEDFWPLNTTLYVRDFKENNENFIYYFLKSIDYLQYSDKAAVPGVNRNHLHMAKIYFPRDVKEQKAIAHILGTLDDKIELNRRMNATLEAMAQALFKSWFVDFDPVIDNALAAGNPIPEPLHAKAEARAALGDKRKPLPEAIQKQFPSSFVFSEEMGWIPEGWEIASIGEFCEIIDCLHSKKPAQLEEDTGNILLQLNNIRDDGLLDLNKKYFVSDEDYKRWTSRIEVRQGDCVITNVGRVGSVSIVPRRVFAAIGRNMTAVRLREGNDLKSFIITLLNSHYMRMEIDRRTDVGTILNALNVKSVPLLRFLNSGQILSSFEYQVSPLLTKRQYLLEENLALSGLRDTLLPKLLSGELRIPDAEKLTLEAI